MKHVLKSMESYRREISYFGANFNVNAFLGSTALDLTVFSVILESDCKRLENLFPGTVKNF